MALTTDNVRMALADFVDNRLLPAISSSNTMGRWFVGGASAVMLARFHDVVETYKPMLQGVGIIDSSGNFSVESIEMFLNSAFEKQDAFTAPLLGINFRFDKGDGDYLIESLRRYGG